MLFTEPILFSLSLYMAFVYGILYLDFTAYPIVYADSRSWSIGISGLSFLGIGVGRHNRLPVHQSYIRPLCSQVGRSLARGALASFEHPCMDGSSQWDYSGLLGQHPFLHLGYQGSSLVYPLAWASPICSLTLLLN